MAPPRVGCVKYLNARPLIRGWPGPVEFDHPASLCRKLAEGNLDVALVSSFEYLRNPVYKIVDDVAIAANGPVYSVFVAHQIPLVEIEEIALDPASATSSNLLHCLLAEQNLRPRLVSPAPGQKETARLLIGDQAIRFRKEHGGEFKFWDLAEEWKRLTALPFVFALWLIRPDVRNAADIADDLRARRDANLASLEELTGEEKEFSLDFCAQYFRNYLHFGFGKREKEGLLRFRSVCEKHRILPESENDLQLV